MIDKSSFEKAVGLADIFASKGLQVVPVAGTPLAHLVSQTNLIGDIPPMVTNTDFTEQDSISLSTLSDNDSHNEIFDSYVQQVSDGLVNQISVARTVVNPIIQQAADSLTELMQTAPVSEYSFELIMKSLPAPLFNESLIEEINKNAVSNVLPVRGSITLTGSDVQDISKFILTGSEIFDQSIGAWLESMGSAWLQGVWDNVYNDIHQTQLNERQDLIQYINSGEDIAEKALVIYLVARRLIDAEVPENVKVKLVQWQETVRDYISVSATTLAKEILAYQESFTRQKLVYKYLPVEKKLFVFENTYKDFINNGGKNEVIFGAVLDNKVPYYTDVLAEFADKYLSIWESYSSINKEAVRLKTFNLFRDSLVSILKDGLNDLTDFEQEKLKANPNFITFLSARFDEEAKKLNTECMQDIYHTVMKMVCECRFPYTNSYVFLDTINDFCRENPDTDVREAALIATIEVLCHHLVEQMNIVQ